MSLAALERYRPLIDDWEAFMKALERPLPTCIWANPLKTTPERLAKRLGADGIALQPVPWHPGAFILPPEVQPGRRLEYIAGHFHVQEEVSLLPVVLLDPQPGERILDMCAAPGNKTVQIATRMKNRGTVVANDRDFRRMRAVSRALDRLGVFNVSMTTYDAANLPGDAGSFDRILADVPCSCEGTSRKNRDVLCHDDPEFASRLTRVQLAILRKAFQLCRPGGRIVYSTCTYAPEENEMVLQAFLDEVGSEALRLRPARIPNFRSAPGLTEWQGQRFDETMTRAMRVLPHHNDSGGFFIAVLEKSNQADSP